MNKRCVPLEVCINADDLGLMCANIDIALQNGAQRIELCSAMHDDGLTPSLQAIRLAREAVSKGQLLVMLRPGRGHFVDSQSEFQQLHEALDMAGSEGADGVVTGVLTEQRQVDIGRLEDIVTRANESCLEVTFHRAFDALAEPGKACSLLAHLGVKRILTSGTPWQSGLSATQGISLLRQYILHESDMEWVIGGGLKPMNAQALLNALPGHRRNVSLHTYSGVMTGEKVDPIKVQRLANLNY